MKTNTKQTSQNSSYGKPSIGLYLDQSYRNSVEHDGATVRLAMEYGFQPNAEDAKLLARLDNDVLSDDRDDSQCLSELADEAIDWLNEQETRPFLYWANDGDAGALGLWPSVENAKEDVGFVSSKAFEFPPDDFVGEWLHVSDHGNATLYDRDENGNDKEIWSVV